MELGDACDATGDELGLVALEVVRSPARERHRPVARPCVDRQRNERVERQRLEDGAAKVGVVASPGIEDPHLQAVMKCLDSGDPLGGLGGFAPLPKAADGPAQRDAAMVGQDDDRLVVDLGVPDQLVLDRHAQFVVVGHGQPPDIGVDVLRRALAVAAMLAGATASALLVLEVNDVAALGLAAGLLTIVLVGPSSFEGQNSMSTPLPSPYSGR